MMSSSVRKTLQPPTARSGLVSAIAVVALALMLPSTIYAAKPSKQQTAPEASVVPAGFGCAFDVAINPLPGADLQLTQFDDGRRRATLRGLLEVRNLASGASRTVAERSQLTISHDGIANFLRVTVKGRFLREFWPGDIGPSGVVSSPGALLWLTGTLSLTADPETGAVVVDSFRGRETDLCSLLE
jgi:hypothetical protein